jgi:DUF4097 and DUF4098 domain-containing protein YvlB
LVTSALPSLRFAVLLSAMPASLAAWAESDTVIAVRREQVLIGDGFSGRVMVEVWQQDRIELTEEGSEGRISLRVTGNQIRLVGAGARRRAAGAVRLRVPAWLPVQLRGGELTATVDGLTGVVDLSTVEGDLALSNMAGDVFASSVDGSVMIDRSTGRLRLRSVEEAVHASRIDAESVLIESTSGSIVMDDVSARSVDATTTDGDIAFTGDIPAGASYRLSTHDGDLLVALPASVSADVTVSTFDGEFLPEIPITLDRFSGGREISFTMGRGGARLTLNAFDGDIVLRRR